MSDASWWARKLGGQQQPPHAPEPSQQGGAWWQTPASVPVQPTPQHPGHQQDSGPSLTYQQLKGMRASEMTQEQMEALAQIELQGEKYHRVCDQCGSDNYIPAGVRVGSQVMSTARCFDCGNGVRSPEPSAGGRSSTAGIKARQIHGGAGNYGHHVSQLPAQFIPRGGT